MKGNSDLKTHEENCNDWEYRKLVNFIPEHENVWIEDLSMTKCYQTYKVEIPYQGYGHVSDNLLAIFGQKVKKSVLEVCELLNT